MRVPWAWRSVRRAPRGRLAVTRPGVLGTAVRARAGPGHARALAARPGPRACPGSTARPPAREAAPPLRPRGPALGVYFSPRWCELGLDVPLSCQRKPPRCADRAPRTDTAGPRRALLHVGASERRGDGHVAPGAARRGPAAVCAQNPVTSAASCGSATVTALKCARSMETRPCGDAPRRGRLLLPSAAALPRVPFAVPAPRGSPPPSGARGGDEAAALGAPRAGALTVFRSCSAGSARQGVPGPTPPPRGACAQAAGAGCAVRM